MRLLIKLAAGLAVTVTLAAGLLPPLLDRGNLANDALTAARAGSALLISTNDPTQAEDAARVSIANDPGIELVNIEVNPDGANDSVSVSVQENVHTFMSDWPGINRWMKSWYRISSTETSSVGT